jgi:hypothetical protein
MRASLWDVEEASSAQVHGCCAQMGSMARSDWKRATSCSVDLDSYYGREKFPLARKGCCDIHCRRVSCGRSKEKEQLVKVCSQTEQEGLRPRSSHPKGEKPHLALDVCFLLGFSTHFPPSSSFPHKTTDCSNMPTALSRCTALPEIECFLSLRISFFARPPSNRGDPMRVNSVTRLPSRSHLSRLKSAIRLTLPRESPLELEVNDMCNKADLPGGLLHCILARLASESRHPIIISDNIVDHKSAKFQV